jgi:D-lactate dehydrogenase (cytochrome)
MALVMDISADPEQCIMASDFTELEEVKSFRHAVPEQINACIAERKKSHPALRKVATDMAVPDNYLKEVFKVYRSRFSEKDLEFAIFGHVGDNHLHVNVLPQDEVELSKALEAYKDIAKEVVKMGGVVSAEHGIGRLKKSFFKEQFSEAELNQLREIKRALDPELRLNMGVLFDM